MDSFLRKDVLIVAGLAAVKDIPDGHPPLPIVPVVVPSNTVLSSGIWEICSTKPMNSIKRFRCPALPQFGRRYRNKLIETDMNLVLYLTLIAILC